MSDWIVPLFWGGAGALVAWMVIRVQLRNMSSRRRDRELQVESARLGLSYQADGLAVVDTFTPFVLLDRRPDGGPRSSETASRGARNLMQGAKRGIGVAVFDFEKTDRMKGSPKSYAVTVTRNTVVVLEDPARPWPTFDLRGIWAGPQAAWTAKALALTKALAADGAGLVEFDSHPQFSSTYVLRGASEADVRRLFADRVLSFFEENPGWIVEGSGPRLLVYRSPDFHPRKDWSFGASPGYIRTESVEQFLAAALDVRAVFG